MSERVTILGAGAWGMAAANLLSSSGHEVTLWEYDESAYEILVSERKHPDRLNGFRLPDSITLINRLEGSLDNADIAVLVTPTQYLRSVVHFMASDLARVDGIVNLAKGIETSTLKRISEIVLEETSCGEDKFVTLSGPSHAEEVIQDMPTTVVAAGSSKEFNERVQRLFSTDKFRVYSTQDIIGVELGGSLKNVIAISAGITDGLGLGDNTKGALITRGLAEITRLGLALGAKSETFAGLSGIGDLVATCASSHSRNRYVGEQIGKGVDLKEILAKMNAVAEGVETARSAYDLANKHEVEMPITTEVYKVLFEGKEASEAVADLMERTLKAEIWR